MTLLPAPPPFRQLTTTALALALAAGCAMFQKQVREEWVDAEVSTKSESVLYEVVHLSLQRAGYPVGIGADKGNRRIETGWFRSESPFRGKGYRQKATVSYEPAEDDTFTVRVRVQRETNESFRPLDPRYAKWEPAEDNPQEGRRILQYVRSYLVAEEPFDVGPEPGAQFR